MTRLRLDSEEYLSSSRPTSVDPVKAAMSTSMCLHRACPTTVPDPGTTLNTPLGTPASAASSARRIALKEVWRAGLRTRLLPAASAGPIFQAAIWTGKFHGTRRPTTPMGSRTIRQGLAMGVGATRS